MLYNKGMILSGVINKLAACASSELALVFLIFLVRIDFQIRNWLIQNLIFGMGQKKPFRVLS